MFEIAGVVKDTKYGDLREEFAPLAFFPAPQKASPEPMQNVLIRSRAPFSAIVPSLKSTLGERSPAIAYNFQSFQTQISESLLRERLMATLSGFFGFLAALLATIGLYGVISYMVVRRTNEVGIRMALGADARQVVAMIMREAAGLLAVGLAVGTVLAPAAAWTAGSMLFGLKPYDPATLLAAVALLTGVALAASYLPARRASRLDPMTALRDE